MSKINFYGKKRPYEDFKKQVNLELQPLIESIREFCFSLGKNVVEDVRMHRIVFCKTMTFRWFLDIEPQNNSILLKIQRNRKESQKIIPIKVDENLDEVKELLRDAYKSIH